MKTLILREKDRNLTEKAVEILSKKGVIIYPTETQYGIGTDATDMKAVKKVFEIKQRPEEKKVLWAFSDTKMIEKHFSLNREQKILVKKLMPGPFTLVINDQGFRIPDNGTARKIISKFGKPITTTSANISREKTPRKIKDIILLFNDKVNMIIDAGDLKQSKPSTVFRWEDRKILRKGPVSKKEIMQLLD